MTVELINTGSELMLGRVLNTHQQWLCRRLADLGYVVSRQVAIADNGPDIQQAVRESLSRADLVITTGGLGPTSDDITRDLIAGLLGRTLVEDASVLAHIKSFFDARNRPMPASTRIQAMVPEGGLVLPNPHGTAPGLALKLKANPFNPHKNPAWLIMLPGPPRELRPMFDSSVQPLLLEKMPLPPPFICKTFRTTGLGESIVEEKVGPWLKPLVQKGLELGYCARPGQVDVRLAAAVAGGEALIGEAEQVVRAKLSPHVFGTENDDLEGVIVRMLITRKETLAVAESCTGGFISHRITNVPGASEIFRAGLITYHNDAKKNFLKVTEAALTAHGAVSKAVAREMAEGVRSVTAANYGISVTGIAGPGGGSEAKPVGTVFIGLAGPFPTIVVHNFNPYDRETFKYISSQQALELLRRKLTQNG